MAAKSRFAPPGSGRSEQRRSQERLGAGGVLVFFNRLGEMRDRTFENQRYRSSGLNLVVAAIILWNTIYLERAIGLLQQKGRTISDDLLIHLSPLGWEHINLTGDYIWQANRRVTKGHFRPLRQPREATVPWFEAVQANS
jgi:Tn3 transposase DDE domain-containing protein